MNVKRIVFIVLCVLLALVLVMTTVTITRVVQLFQGSGVTPPPSTNPSASATEDFTDPTVESSTAPTIESTAPPKPTESTAPTESTGSGHVHQFSTVISSQDPTCTDSGYRELLCSCGQIHWELIDKLAHSFGYGQTITGNCITDGCTRYTCSVCGTVENRNVVPAPGHKYGTGIHHDATCAEDAYTEFFCTNPGCPEPQKTEVEKGTALGHKFGNWIEQNGVLTQTCSVCKTTQTTADLTITGSEFLDAPDGSYRVYEIHVGTKHSPNMYLYKITDYINNGTLIYRYNFEDGLTVAYVDKDQSEQVIRLGSQGGQATISPNTAPDPTDPSEGSQPTESTQPSQPAESTPSTDSTDPAGTADPSPAARASEPTE